MIRATIRLCKTITPTWTRISNHRRAIWMNSCRPLPLGWTDFRTATKVGITPSREGIFRSTEVIDLLIQCNLTCRDSLCKALNTSSKPIPTKCFQVLIIALAMPMPQMARKRLNRPCRVILDSI